MTTLLVSDFSAWYNCAKPIKSQWSARKRQGAMGLRIQRAVSVNSKLVIILVAAFVLLMQPLYGLVSSRIASAAPESVATSAAGFNSFAWSADRTSPFAYSKVADKLTFTVDQTKTRHGATGGSEFGSIPTSTFYKWEGFKSGALPVNTNTVRASLFIDPEWQSKPVSVSMWGATTDGSTTGWPIIAFSNGYANTTTSQGSYEHVNDSFTGFRVYDTRTGLWSNTLETDSSIWGSTVDMEISTNPYSGQYEFFVNGAKIANYNNDGKKQLTGVIYNNVNQQTNNSSDNYYVKWTNFSTGTLKPTTPANVRFVHSNTNAAISSGSSVDTTDVKLRWDTINSPSRYRITVTHPDGTQANFQPSTSAVWNPASMDWNISDAVRSGLFGAQAGDKGDGVYSYTVAVQNNGVWSLESSPITLIYDTKAPVIENISIDKNITNNSQIRVVGTVKDDSLKNYNIRIYDDDKTTLVTPWTGYTGLTNIENGTLATLNIGSLADGNYWVRVWADDILGNRSGVASHIYVPFTIDRDAPEVDIISTISNDDGTYTIRGTTNDNSASVVVNVNGSELAPVAPSDGIWQIVTDVLSAGPYVIIAESTDAAGNKGVSTSRSFTVPQPAPEVTVPETNNPAVGPVGPDAPSEDTDEGEIIVGPAIAFVGTASQIAAAVADNNEEVLGVQTDDSDRRSIFGDDTSDVLGVTASPKNADGLLNMLGLAWYWWLLVVAAVIGFGWWLIAAIRRRQEEAADV